MCFITELFFSDSVSLHASHLSLPDATVRCSPLNWFNVCQAFTFESAVPWTFRFFFFSWICLHFAFSWNYRFRCSTQSYSCFCGYPQRIWMTFFTWDTRVSRVSIFVRYFEFSSKNRWPSSTAASILRPWSVPGGGSGSFFTGNT